MNNNFDSQSSNNNNFQSQGIDTTTNFNNNFTGYYNQPQSVHNKQKFEAKQLLNVI